MHPFLTTNHYDLWFIKAVNITAFINGEHVTLTKHPLSQVSIKPPDNVNQIYDINKNAYNTYLEKKEINFGYILVSNDPSKTNEYSYILLESSLLKNIRQTWYSGNTLKYVNDNRLDKYIYIPLLAYLNVNTRMSFIIMFPQYIELYNKIVTTTNTFIEQLFLIKEGQNISVPFYITSIYNYISTIVSIDANNIDTRNILTSILTNNSDYIRVYYMYIKNEVL